MESALLERDFVQAQRLAHTLGGLAGTIGAITLHPHVLTLENLLRDPVTAQSNQATEALLAVKQGLSSQVESIIEALDLLEPLASPATVHAADAFMPWTEVVQQLLALLQDDDPSAQKHFAMHQAALEQHFPQHIEALQAAMDAFALDEALRIVQSAIALSATPETAL
jgi:two-component system sensor histidine kinase/response regulator